MWLLFSLSNWRTRTSVFTYLRWIRCFPRFDGDFSSIWLLYFKIVYSTDPIHDGYSIILEMYTFKTPFLEQILTQTWIAFEIILQQGSIMIVSKVENIRASQKYVQTCIMLASFDLNILLIMNHDWVWNFYV